MRINTHRRLGLHNPVEQWFSTFLTLQPFNAIHVVMTHSHKIIMLLHNCNFATVINYNTNILEIEACQCCLNQQIENCCSGEHAPVTTDLLLLKDSRTFH